MIASTTKSRLFELRRDRAAVQRNTELLERKREVLLREISRRLRERARLREIVAAAYHGAKQELDVARVELGMDALEAASLAQPRTVTITTSIGSLMGVRVQALECTVPEFRAAYGTAATPVSLDHAGAAFTAALPLILELAQAERALSRLRVAMRKTTKLAAALRKVLLPRIERDIRAAVEGIEEEERDEATRRKSWRKHA
jgi:V/A-type H+-transporting ATPase subunit D